MSPHHSLSQLKRERELSKYSWENPVPSIPQKSFPTLHRGPASGPPTAHDALGLATAGLPCASRQPRVPHFLLSPLLPSSLQVTLQGSAQTPWPAWGLKGLLRQAQVFRVQAPVRPHLRTYKLTGCFPTGPRKHAFLLPSCPQAGEKNVSQMCALKTANKTYVQLFDRKETYEFKTL